jgi:hypothetical protein
MIGDGSMRYEVLVVNNDHMDLTKDMILIADSKREILTLLANNLGETLSGTSIKIEISEME